MADDLSLLFRLRADNTQAKAVVADTRAVVNQLRQSFGPQLTQTLTVANKSFSDIDGTLTNFVAQRVPLVGGAITRVTDALKGLGGESAKTEKKIAGIAKSIESIAKESGKSVPQIASFLAKFIQLEGQAARDKSAIDFFGASLGTKLIPELEKTGTALAAVSAESAAAGASIAALAGPIALVVLEFLALAAGAVLAAKEIFELSKRTAEFQGKMFDLAQQTGLTVKTLSAFEVIATTTGGRLETITQALVQFQRKLDEAQDPLSKTAELFRKFNIDTSDTETSLRSAFTALARMPEGFAQTNAAAELFGARGGKQVLAILKETNGDLDGAIKRFRELGILISEEDARAADRLNDELAILDFQLRAASAALVRELIPSLTEIVRSFGDVVRAARPFIDIAARIAGVTGRALESTFLGLSVTVQALTGDIEGLNRTLKELENRKNIPALNIPDLQTPLPRPPSFLQSASEAAVQADALIAIVKRSVAEQTQALSVLFQQGRRNREQQAEETIAANKRVLEADKQSIDARLALKEQEIKALDEAQVKRGETVRRDTEDYRAITAEISKLQQERLDKESLFDITSREIRARAAKERADSRRNEIQNETDLITTELDRQAKNIEAQIERGEVAEESGLTTIEQLERAKIEIRIKSRERQREVGFLTVQDQVDIDAELRKLNQEQDQLADAQRNRRLQRERDAGQRTVDILVANIDTLIQLEQIAGERRIATINTLAQQRVISEEEAAQQILQIRLDVIDDEIEATKTKLDAAKSITDKNERVRAQTELNNQIRVLTEQRKGIQDEGEREIEAGRQRDLNNERRYADDLKEIKKRIRDIERDAAEEVIRLMQIHFASRRDIIRTRVRLDLDDENARHRQALETIRGLEQENRESNKTQEEKLEVEKELNGLREAEAERHRLAMQGIKDAGRRDEIEAGPFGGFVTGLESGQLAELENGVQSFADVAKVAFSAVGAVVNGLAQGVGNLVQQWVLLGTTGPGAFRKLVASVLAGVAAQAATLAIMELAYGIAALTPWGAAIYGPAPFHFKSAALFGSIALATGLAGRAVAGGLFQSVAGAVGGSARGGGAVDRRTEPRPIDLARTQQNQRLDIFLHTEPGRGFGQEVVRAIVDDVRSNGDAREVIIHTAKES